MFDLTKYLYAFESRCGRIAELKQFIFDDFPFEVFINKIIKIYLMFVGWV